jgi:rod shape-determining protein MreC
MLSRHRALIILGIVLAAELSVLVYQVHKGRDLSMVRQWPILLVTPVGKGFGTVSGGAKRIWRNYLDLRGASRENERLLRELNDVKMENQRLQTEEEQAQRLQVLLQFKQQALSETVAAQVVSSGGTETARMVLLDKGQEAGLRPDMAVMVPDGIVGKVLRVFPHAAQVLLLSDANSGVACLLENSRVHGVLKGQNKQLCTLGYIPNDEKVEIGEKIFTSGEDRIYPKGLPVGVVIEAHPGPAFQEIWVRPFAKLNRLEEVLVVTKKVDSDFPAPAVAGQTVAGTPPTAPDSEHGSSAPVKPGEEAFVASQRRPQPSSSSNIAPDPAAPRPAVPMPSDTLNGAPRGAPRNGASNPSSIPLR